MRRFFMAIALLAAPMATHAQEAPIRGTWSGDVYQDGQSTPYTATITVDGARGTIEYGGATPCRGTLEGLRYPNGQLYGNMYEEHILTNRYDMNARNPSGCIDGGTVTLGLTPSGQLVFRWVMDWGNDIMRAGGELDPRR